MPQAYADTHPSLEIPDIIDLSLAKVNDVC